MILHVGLEGQVVKIEVQEVLIPVEASCHGRFGLLQILLGSNNRFTESTDVTGTNLV